ncbi:MAG TPA: SPOR domain-containing protein [Candidatus Elarobacter sp.]|nr:SPOR domain-containing protein [Candidatus Elarobacter sp.]
MYIYRFMIGIGTVAAMAAPMAGHAQAADSSQYVAAQRLVANGDAAKGRRMVDSLLKETMPGTASYAEGLYWRATLATNARDSERDYRQIVVDYPLSSRVPDALLRMGELESQRGDRDAALQHFQRLAIEHPESPLRAEASYWIARTYLERNDTQHGCAANADALAQVRASNIELKNRIDFQQQACRGVAIAPVPASVPAAATPAPRSAAVPREVPVKGAPASAPVTVPASAAATERAESVKSATPSPRVAAKPPAESATVAVATKTNSTTTNTTTTVTTPVRRPDTAVAPAPAPAPARVTSTTSTTTRTTSASASGGYSVQVAAFSSRAQGEALAAKLRGRGYDAHVDGMQAPFRVRIGRFATYAAAAAELRQLKAKKMDGFIAEP